MMRHEGVPEYRHDSCRLEKRVSRVSENSKKEGSKKSAGKGGERKLGPRKGASPHDVEISLSEKYEEQRQEKNRKSVVMKGVA